MATNSTTEVTFYSSTFRHGVDEKRRVQIPAKWRPAEPDMEFMLILWPNGSQAEASLLVLPPSRAASLAGKITEMSSTDQRAQSLRRLLGSNSASAKLDKSGRIMLPEEMAKKAGIDKDAVLVGLVDRFEIWNPERYEAVSKADAALLSEAFKLI